MLEPFGFGAKEVVDRVLEKIGDSLVNLHNRFKVAMSLNGTPACQQGPLAAGCGSQASEKRALLQG